MAYENRIVRLQEFMQPRKERVACANCFFARRVLKRKWVGNRPIGAPVEKVCCSKGLWPVSGNGKGAFVDFYAIWNRVREDCHSYISMSDDPSDLDDFISSLPQCKTDYESVSGRLHV